MWRDPTSNKQKQRTFRLKSHAARFARELEDNIGSGRPIDRNGKLVGDRSLEGNTTTVGAYAQKYNEARRHSWSPATIERAEIDVRKWILSDQIGSLPLAAVTQTDINTFIGRLSAAQLAPNYIRAIYGRLVAVLRAAHADGLILRMPIRSGVVLPRRPSRPVSGSRLLTVEQVRQIAEAVPNRLRALVWLQAGTGLRPAEALGVTLDELDLSPDATLVVRHQLRSPNGSGPPVLSRLMTSTAERLVPLAASVADHLRSHLDEFEPTPMSDESGDPFWGLFGNANGHPIRRNSHSEMWRRISKELALPDFARGWHELRHFHASLLIAQNVNVRTVQARLGHTSAEQTLRTYAHLWPDSDDLTRAAVDEVLAPR